MSPLSAHDVWTRLALLDQRCEVAVYSTFIPQSEGRIWAANARRRDDHSRFVEVSGESMLDALMRLLLEAETQRLAE